MLKSIFSIILLIVFTNFIAIPAIITLVDNTDDVSLVFNVNEKENKENESEKDIEIELLQIENPYDSFMDFSGKMARLCNENYSKHYSKLHLPPPELS